MSYQYSEKKSLPSYNLSNEGAGFRQEILKKEETGHRLHKDYNHLLFLLDGEITLSCNQFIRKTVGKGQFVLIPVAADIIYRAEEDSYILFFSFERFFNITNNTDYIKELRKNHDYAADEFCLLDFCTPLEKFTSHIASYLALGIDKPVLHEIKHLELQFLLQSFYSQNEIAHLFCPIIGVSPAFRISVLRNYRNVVQIEDLATLFGLEKRTFGRQFKEEFGLSPYQWLLNQKAKHVYFSLAESDETLDDIRHEHGFKYAGHFTRFCKDYYNDTPKKLMRRIRYQEH